MEHVRNWTFFRALCIFSPVNIAFVSVDFCVAVCTEQQRCIMADPFLRHYFPLNFINPRTVSTYFEIKIHFASVLFHVPTGAQNSANSVPSSRVYSITTELCDGTRTRVHGNKRRFRVSAYTFKMHAVNVWTRDLRGVCVWVGISERVTAVVKPIVNANFVLGEARHKRHERKREVV